MPFSSVRVQLWFLQNKNLDFSLFRNFYSIFVIQKPVSLVPLYFLPTLKMSMMTFMKRENKNLGFHLSKTWQILMHFARALHQAYTSVFLKSDVCVFSTTLKIGATFNRMIIKKANYFF